MRGVFDAFNKFLTVVEPLMLLLGFLGLLLCLSSAIESELFFGCFNYSKHINTLLFDVSYIQFYAWFLAEQADSHFTLLVLEQLFPPFNDLHKLDKVVYIDFVYVESLSAKLIRSYA